MLHHHDSVADIVKRLIRGAPIVYCHLRVLSDLNVDGVKYVFSLDILSVAHVQGGVRRHGAWVLNHRSANAALGRADET